MKIAIYPGSFNPWHEGHDDVLRKALFMFDKVVIAVGKNPDKDRSFKDLKSLKFAATDKIGVEESHRIDVVEFEGLLADFANSYYDNEGSTFIDPVAIIRGLRNVQDFEMEKIQQYHNEDLGLKLPTVYIISDRRLVHVSSSAIRAIEKARKS